MQIVSGMNEMLGCGVRVAFLSLMLTSQTGTTPHTLLPPLHAQSPSGAHGEKVQVHWTSPCSSRALSPAWKAGPGGCYALGSQAGSHRLDPRSPAPAGLGAAFSAPLPPGPSGASVAAAVELRRGRQTVRGGPCQGSREGEGCAQEVRSHLKGTIGAEA